jgi:hypothetical protein
MAKDTHTPGTGKGEEKGLKRRADGLSMASSGANRPTGERTARDSTGINAKQEEPIDPQMPNMPPA